METYRVQGVARIAPFAPLALILCLAACGGRVAASRDVSDAGDANGVGDTSEAEAGADAADTASPGSDAPIADVHVCSGHDEDGDGVPDECDDCPNVPDPAQAGPAGLPGSGRVGAACASAMLGADAKRLAWDPFLAFATPSSWRTFGAGAGAFALAPEGDSILGGSTGDLDLRFVSGPVGASPGSAGVAVTAIVSVLAEGGSLPHTGLIARVGGATGGHFYMCGLGVGVGFFYLLSTSPGTSCDGGTCSPVAFNYDPGAAHTSQQPFPSDVSPALGRPIGVRITVTTAGGGADAGATTGDVACQLFDPAAPATLLAAEPAHLMRLTIPTTSRWFGEGEVGVYAQGTKVRVHSLDVLTKP